MAKKAPKPKGRPATPPPATPVEVVYVNPLFKIVLLILVLFFLLLLFLALNLSAIDTTNARQDQLFTFCSHGAELILGAIVGLLGGKGIDSFAERVERPKP